MDDTSSLRRHYSESESNNDNIVDSANPSNPFEFITTPSTNEPTPNEFAINRNEPIQNEVNPKETSSLSKQSSQVYISDPFEEITAETSYDPTLPNNDSSIIEFPTPAIIRTSQTDIPTNPFHALIEYNKNNSSLDRKMCKDTDEISPPPYPTDSKTSPSHSGDHITITFASPPEYTESPITTQSQPMSQSSHYSSLEDISANGSPNDESLNSTQLKYCKICQESDSPSSQGESVTDCSSYRKGKLISPCKCKGSLQYIHLGCLNQWRNSNVREEASYRCEVCKYEYKFYRTRLAKIFTSYFTLHFLTIILLFAIVYLVSYIVKLFDARKEPLDLPKDRWQDTPFLYLHVIHFIIGISIVSTWGLMFFMCLVCFNGFVQTRQTYCYCGGCGEPYSCSSGSCGSGLDCGGSGGDCGVFMVIIAAIVLITIFIFGLSCAIIAAYLFVQKIISIYLEKIHERILDVNKD
ncbi:14008_t:CDS:1 [Funneliformis mosseae]|uniref:14008_t:CDS:1 n=1 Tax=Funneliformis mosseae TaxID=27381 RepID=A0A9N9C4L3_FUNMO|nr:14008_t:CDS:1 [Funneliformis mosseae]